MEVFKTAHWISIAIFIIPQICGSGKLSHWFRNVNLTSYLASTNELYTLTLDSQLMCINECTKTTNCLSVFYIHKTCRLNNVYFSSTTGLVPVNGSEYFGSGSSCSPNPCLHGGTCSKAGSSFKCDCSADRRGSRCETEPCNPDPCVHGTCIKSDVAAGFRCHCREDIKGYLCDIDDD